MEKDKRWKIFNKRTLDSRIVDMKQVCKFSDDYELLILDLPFLDINNSIDYTDYVITRVK